MHKILNVALIAHDKKKDTLVSFCIAYEGILAKYGLYATGTTGKRISRYPGHARSGNSGDQ